MTSPLRSLLLIAVVLLAGIPARATSLENFRERLDHRSDSPGAVAAAIVDWNLFLRTQPSQGEIDSAILAFRAFYLRQVSEANSRLGGETGLSLGDPLPPRLRASLQRDGMKLWSTEGIYCVIPDPNFLAQRVARRGSPAIRTFHDLEAHDWAGGFQDDMALMISRRALAQRLVAWEKYRAQWPGSPLATDADCVLRAYNLAFWLGLDNTPNFDWETTRIVPTFRSALLWLTRQHPDLPAGQRATKALAILSRTKDQHSSAYDEFIRGEGIFWAEPSESEVP